MGRRGGGGHRLPGLIDYCGVTAIQILASHKSSKNHFAANVAGGIRRAFKVRIYVNITRSRRCLVDCINDVFHDCFKILERSA